MSLSIGDLVQLFFGRATTANQLRTPLQEFVRERALKGNQPTEENLDRAIDSVIHDLHPHLVLTAVSAFLYFYLIKFVFVKSYQDYPEYFLILRIFYLIFLFLLYCDYLLLIGFQQMVTFYLYINREMHMCMKELIMSIQFTTLFDIAYMTFST